MNVAEQVLGRYCDGNHFNDPAVAYCATCGVAMVQTEGAAVWAARPPLGVVVADDGTVSPLATDHVMGETRLVADGWDVLVIADGEDTSVLWPGDTEWTELPKGSSSIVESGTAIACGRSQLHYHSYRSSPSAPA